MMHIIAMIALVFGIAYLVRGIIRERRETKRIDAILEQVHAAALAAPVDNQPPRIHPWWHELRLHKTMIDRLIDQIDLEPGGAEHLAAVECLCDRIARGEKV